MNNIDFADQQDYVNILNEEPGRVCHVCGHSPLKVRVVMATSGKDLFIEEAVSREFTSSFVDCRMFTETGKGDNDVRVFLFELPACFRRHRPASVALSPKAPST